MRLQKGFGLIPKELVPNCAELWLANYFSWFKLSCNSITLRQIKSKAWGLLSILFLNEGKWF